jgi:hypothetical protein
MKIALTKFAAERHTPTSGRSFFKGDAEQLIGHVAASWHMRRAGQGRQSLDEVVVVPMPYAVATKEFQCNTVLADESTRFVAGVERRQEKEEPFISVRAHRDSPTIKTTHAWVVCYHYGVLSEDEREGVTADWYIVSIGASDTNDEPMYPLTMARNQLGLEGGTKVDYPKEEWARAVHYWSIRCQKDTSKSSIGWKIVEGMPHAKVGKANLRVQRYAWGPGPNELSRLELLTDTGWNTLHDIHFSTAEEPEDSKFGIDYKAAGEDAVARCMKYADALYSEDQ